MRKSNLEVVEFVGRLEENSSYVILRTKGDEKPHFMGDIMWCDNDCSEVEISEDASPSQIEEFLNWFVPSQRKAVKGFLRRCGGFNL